MELNRFLLLAAFLMNAQLPKMISLPMWCDQKIVSRYADDACTMEKDMEKSPCVPQLPNDTLPNVAIRVQEWKNKSMMVQREEIYSALNMLFDVVKAVTVPNTTDCKKVPLAKLVKNLRTLRWVVLRSPTTQEGATPAPLLHMDSRGTLLKNILQIFNCYCNLMKKVAMFLESLRQANCSKSSR